jgi:hypothetical protein
MMFRTIRSWHAILVKLGFTKARKTRRHQRNAYSRELRAERLEDRWLLATVTTNLDVTNPNDGVTSLREAIVATLSGGTVDFSTNPVHGLNGATIDLLPALGQIVFNKSLTIDASMLSNGITIDANDPDRGQPGELLGNGIRIFNITDPTFGTSPPSVTLIGLTLKGADVSGNGGAISAACNLTVIDSTIAENYAGRGGGIDVFGGNYSATLQASRLTGNQATGQGGGMYFLGKQLLVESSEIRDNEASVSSYSQGGGGGIEATVSGSNAAITIEQSSIEGNKLTGVGSNGAGASFTGHSAQITILNSQISGNQALGLEANGGGLNVYAYTNSYVLMDRVKITNNHADDDVGGLHIYNQSSVTKLTNCTISGNTASFNAEGTANYAAGVAILANHGAQTFIENSTISGNRVTPGTGSGSDGSGAGLSISHFTSIGQGTTTILNSTISGNEALGSGGGILLTGLGQVVIRHSTIINNRADSDGDGNGSDSGGGIRAGFVLGIALTLDHTIVAGNLSGTGATRDDINGEVTASWSLIGDRTGATITDNGGNQLGTGAAPISPGLLPLAWNGGPTETHALAAGSLAIDNGDPAAAPGVGSVPLYDQRGAGFARTVDTPDVRDPGARIDIGAYEVGLAKVIDVRLDGSLWQEQDLVYSYAEIVPAGKQLVPIYTQGVNTIQIVFSEAVTFPADPATALTIRGNNRQAISQTISSDPTASLPTWNLSAPLGPGKYALELSGVKGAGDIGLDGEWTNYDGPDESTHTPDNFLDDKPQQLVSGDGNAGTIFEFWFSVLPGDSNQDGIVYDGTQSWIVNWIDGVPPSDILAVQDINGDGLRNNVDEALINLIVDTVDYVLPFMKTSGDYADDEIVDNVDFDLWRATFGSTTDLRADSDLSGQVWGNEYIPWRSRVGMYSAWNTEPMGSTSAAGFVVDFGNAPFIWDVIVGGSTSTHVPLSYLVATSGWNHLATVPVANVDTVSILFSEHVNVEASHLKLVGLRTADVPTLVEFSYDIGTNMATWRFDDMIQRDHYLISLTDAVTDVEGNRLDGEFTNFGSLNPTVHSPSEDPLPSGDGNAGGQFNLVITLLAGDATLDGFIDASGSDWSDYSIVESYYEQSVAEFWEGDFFGDGFVDDAELLLITENAGFSLQEVWVLADLDGDFDVDESDVETLADNMGMSNATHEDGDLDDDGDVDEDDLALAFAQYGLDFDVVS